MTITLNKALKLKNKLGSKLNKLGQKIKTNNSYKEGNIPSYNIRTLLEEYHNTSIEITNLKLAINKSNINIYEKMIKMSERKAFISIINDMSTNEGMINDNPYRDNSVDKKFTAIISEVEKNKIIEETEQIIESLQDEIDLYNATTTIEI